MEFVAKESSSAAFMHAYYLERSEKKEEFDRKAIMEEMARHAKGDFSVVKAPVTTFYRRWAESKQPDEESQGYTNEEMLELFAKTRRRAVHILAQGAISSHP